MCIIVTVPLYNYIIKLLVIIVSLSVYVELFAFWLT